MRASFAFPPSDFSFAVDGSGVSWYGRCSADFMDTSPESYPSRGGVTFLNHFQCELSILAREEGALDRTLHAVGLDERIAQMRSEGYDQSDVLLMRHWNATDSFPEFLGVSIALAKPKLMHFARFFEKQFPRSDVSVGISCMFHGFREPHFDVELPTKEEFLDGAQYFITGEHSLTFSIRK